MSTMPLSVDEAILAEQEGRLPKLLMFWGHHPPPSGGLGSGCLSQWWPAEFTDGCHVFQTAEHFMMAHKAWLFEDEEIARAVLAAPTPGAAKDLGRRVRGFDKEHWTQQRLDIVARGSVAKSGSTPELRSYLLGTGNRLLVEASPVDRVWGIGLAADSPDAVRPPRWRGLNLLGFALVRAREELAASA